MIYVFKFLLVISLFWPSLVLGMTYVGGSWVDDTAYVYNGTSWVEATKWHYTGSAWQEIEAGAPPEDQTLTINPVPSNGSIVEPGDGTNINCGTGGSDCEQAYQFNTNVTLTAVADSGYQLDSWTGVDVDNGDGTADVTMDSAKTVTASFVGESSNNWPDDPANAIYISVDTDGTGDYTTLASAIDAVDSACDLANYPCVITCKGSTIDTSGVLVDISTSPSETNRLIIRAESPHNNYILNVSGSTNIDVKESYVTIRGLHLITDNASKGIDTYSYRTHIVVDSCIIEGGSAGIYINSSDSDQSGFIVSNNIVYNGVVGIRNTSSSSYTDTVYIVNNTVYNSSDSGFYGSTSASNIFWSNNISANNGTDFNGCSGDYNISTDSTAPGSNSIISASINDISFVSTNPGSEDLHIQSGSIAESVGYDYTAVITWDIDADLRSNPFDIGADQL